MTQQVDNAGGAQNRTSGECRGDRELVVTRTFNAPPSTVYRPWSQPELFQRQSISSRGNLLARSLSSPDRASPNQLRVQFNRLAIKSAR